MRKQGFMMKNNQSEQLMEPTNVRPIGYAKNVDFLTHTVKNKGHFTTNNRAVAISFFYENNFKPKFQNEYREGVDKFPNLFNKKKSEFLKFANVNESTQRIIKTYLSSGIPRGAAGKPSGSPF